MSSFNLTALQNIELTEAFDTTFVPVPENEDGYVAVITKYELKAPKSSVILDITWEIDDAGVTAVTGREKNSVRQSIFLDMTDHGTLDAGKGKNVGLGKLREALGQNQKGKPWSFGSLVGACGRIFVKQRVMDDGNVNVDVKKVMGL